MGDGSVPAGWMGSVVVPALVIDGEASPEFMHQAAQASAEALPNASNRQAYSIVTLDADRVKALGLPAARLYTIVAIPSGLGYF